MHRDCDDGCGELANERLRYFTGRHMTARDFRDEQAYHRSHRHLHNRMLHGWGVVCGLDVHPHPVPECRPRYVKVDCGFALDCCGREIAVPKETVSPEIPWDRRPGSQSGNGQQSAPPPPPASKAVFDQGGPATTNNDDSEEERWVLVLCLRYDETPVEPLPVLYNEQNCDPQRHEHSRIREGYTLEWHWVREADLHEYQWKTGGGGCPDDHDGAPCIEDDCEDGDGPSRCCLDPQCPPHDCIPIAVVTIDEQGPVAKENISIIGRPSTEPPEHALTHICRINWPHGGVISRGELEQNLSELRIRFDRRLLPEAHSNHCGPRGVNACTFIVQFGGGYEDLDFVTFTDPPRLEHDCVAVYTIDPRSRKGHGYRDEPPFTYLENHTVFVTLKCDFILDCHGVPVDGNHLGGILPSGDGVRGGTFESWFHVVSDREWESDYERKQQPDMEQTSW